MRIYLHESLFSNIPLVIIVCKRPNWLFSSLARSINFPSHILCSSQRHQNGFFNHTMAHSIKQSTRSDPKEISTSTRSTRSMPGKTHKDIDIYKHADPTVTDRYKQQMTQRKMLFMRSLLRAQVSQMMNCMSTFPVDGYRQLYRTYKINNTLLHESSHLKMYEAKNLATPNTSMAVRIYSKAVNEPNSSTYLKILRHLGRKHPYIIHTWEMFNDNDKVYVFQEWATLGNLVEYMEQSEPLSERRAAVWAKQIYRALDFLGDQAIAHRDLAPIHLVVQPQYGNEVWLKLTGFKQSIIYWDISNNDVQFCQCWPVERQATDGPNFQPPEVYGNPQTEQFDPIQADIWSFGANIYYMLVKQYPYNVTDPYENIDEEIWHNIVKAKLSNDCKCFIFALMRGNANDRMPFDFIEGQPWMRANSALITQKGNVNSKHNVSTKSSRQVKQPRVIAKDDAAHVSKPPNVKSTVEKFKVPAGKSSTSISSGNTGVSQKTTGKSKAGSKPGGKSGAKIDGAKIGRCWCKTEKNTSKPEIISIQRTSGSDSGNSTTGSSIASGSAIGTSGKSTGGSVDGESISGSSGKSTGKASFFGSAKSSGGKSGGGETNIGKGSTSKSTSGSSSGGGGSVGSDSSKKE